MDIFRTYTFASAGWLALQAAPLIISPSIIITMLNPEVRGATTLELYFSRSLGFSLLTLALMLLLLTGVVPLTTSASDGVTDTSDPAATYATPTITISFVYHVATAFYSWARWQGTSQTSNALGTIGSGLLTAMGLWWLLFGGSNGRVSRKTGADKRTSNFPFSNKESASHRKSEWKKAR